MSNRGKKLALNTIASLTLQVVTVIWGFILPRLILGTYGSEVNGLVNSITQFLGVITLLDLGVGTVVQSSLYKPLAENDEDAISKIYVSASKFFRRLATILLVYIVVLIFAYPFLVNKSYDFSFTALLIGAISISSFAQYYFGIVNSLLLSADQRSYVQYTAQIVTLIINTIACAVLIKSGCSIQLVKLVTSLIFLARPFYLMWYVNKHYIINKKITYTEEPIKQKWNGMAQHFAAYVLGGTDNIVLTLFSTLANVSIYSVYYLVVNGVLMIIVSASNGLYSYFGDLWAKKEKEKIETEFQFFEWFMHMFSILIFGCESVLIVDFIYVYTNGITDVDYFQPVFSVLLVIAFMMRAIRIPYNYMILAAGHYKQTQSNYVIAMILNIFISIVTVKIWGLIGVALGTLIAMMYQTLWMCRYDYKTFFDFKCSKFIKLIVVDFFCFMLAYLISSLINFEINTYFMWAAKAIVIFIIWLVVIVLANLILYRDRVLALKQCIFKKLRR